MDRKLELKPLKIHPKGRRVWGSFLTLEGENTVYDVCAVDNCDNLMYNKIPNLYRTDKKIETVGHVTNCVLLGKYLQTTYLFTEKEIRGPWE